MSHPTDTVRTRGRPGSPARQSQPPEDGERAIGVATWSCTRLQLLASRADPLAAERDCRHGHDVVLADRRSWPHVRQAAVWQDRARSPSVLGRISLALGAVVSNHHK